MPPGEEDSERSRRVKESSLRNSSELGKPGGKASEIKVQLLFLLFKSLDISCKFSLLANTQKWHMANKRFGGVFHLLFNFTVASLRAAPCQSRLHFGICSSWTARRPWNGHSSMPEYATNPAEHLTSWCAWSLEFVPHSDLTVFQEPLNEKRLSGHALWNVAGGDAVGFTRGVLLRHRLDTLQKACERQLHSGAH